MTLGPNAEWVLQAFERWNAGDRTPPLERFDPDVEIHTVIGGGRPWQRALSRARERSGIS